MVSGAIQGVKKVCALVREAKEAGQEVLDLTSQVTGHVGKVLEHTQELKKAEIEVRKNPPKGKSRQVLAFEEAARKLELKRQYEQLRTMIIYELGLPGGFWADFEATLQRLDEEYELELAQAEQQRKQAEWQRDQIRRDVEQKLVAIAGTLLAVGYLAALLWAIHLHQANQLSLPWG
jgi:hypothetical protein